MSIAGGEYGTALQVASFTGYLEVVKLLLEKGADVNVQGTSFVIPRICS
jgi:ankyrin repeat protein